MITEIASHLSLPLNIPVMVYYGTYEDCAAKYIRNIGEPGVVYHWKMGKIDYYGFAPTEAITKGD